jgi:type VI secretion protein, VC_A0114 family
MTVPHRVVWSEGLLISPQHLQQADLYHERLLDRRLAALAPQTWGILSLELDSGALGADQLRVSRFVGILPDGLYLGFAAGDPEAPAARPIGTHFPPAQAVLEVFVAVPKERDGVPSVAAEAADGSQPAAEDGVRRTRFRAATRPVGDMTGESADLPIAFARRNISVLFGDEIRDDFDSIKIAEIVRNASGALVASEAFIPSVLSISASPLLCSSVRRLLALTIAKQRQLSEERRQRDAVTVEFGAGDVTRYLQLSALNAAIPILAHAGRDSDLSPRELYLYLIQMAGQLSTLVPDADPSSLPAFNFTDLRSTFEELFALLTSLLRASVREACLAVPMEVREGLQVGSLHDERIAKCSQFVLAAQAPGISEEQLARELPSRAKIASLQQLPFLLRSATRGLGLQVTHRPPAEVPVRPHVAYFLIDVAGGAEHWRHVLHERSLAIYLPPPYDPAQLKLEIFAIPAKA